MITVFNENVKFDFEGICNDKMTGIGSAVPTLQQISLYSDNQKTNE